MKQEKECSEPASHQTNQPSGRVSRLGDRPRSAGVKSGLQNDRPISYVSTERHQRRGSSDSNDTAIWDPQPTLIEREVAEPSRLAFKQKEIAIERPLSPPLTPQLRNSWETFSIDLELDKIRPPPRISQHLDMKSPPSTASNSSHRSPNGPAVPSSSHPRPHSSHYHNSLHSTAPKHLSSLKAPTDSHESLLSSLDLAYKRHNSLPRSHSSSFSLSSRHSFDSFDLDADLEPLPPDLSTDPDFCASVPWLESPKLPAVSRLLRHDRHDSDNITVASSLDSAAPPPISLGIQAGGKNKAAVGWHNPTDVPKRWGAINSNDSPQWGNMLSLEATKSVHDGIRLPAGAPTSNRPSISDKSRPASSSSGGKGKLQKPPPHPTPTNSSKSILPFRALQRSGYPKPTTVAPSPPTQLLTNRSYASSKPSIFSTLRSKRPTKLSPSDSSSSVDRNATHTPGGGEIVRIAGREYSLSGLGRMPSHENFGVSSLVRREDGRGLVMKRENQGASWFDRQGV